MSYIQKLNEQSLSMIEKTSNCSLQNLSLEMTRLLQSIDHIRDQPHVTLDEIFHSANSNSTIGKLYQLYLLLRNVKNNLLFNEDKTDSDISIEIQNLINKLNQMNFIEFINQIERIAKENYSSKEYVYDKVVFV